MKFIFSTLLITFSLQLYSQNLTLLNSENESLVFAKIFSTHQDTILSTNELGVVDLSFLPEGKHELHIRHSSIQDTSILIAIPLTTSTIKLKSTSLYKEFSEVVVSATLKAMSKKESPVNIEVYSSSYFESNPTPSLFESMQNVNGVRPQLNCNVCNTGDIHINGLEGPYTMILIDGMPIVSGLSTVYGLSGIPQSMIERVEIIKGPASTLYGSEAVGGLINVITKDPAFANTLAVNTMLSSWGETNIDLSKGYKLNKNIKGIVGLNFFNYSLPIDNNKDNFTDVTLSSRLSLFNTLNYTNKSGKHNSIAMRYVYEDRWGGEMNWNKNFRGSDSIYGESIYTNRWEFFSKHQLDKENRWNFQLSANGHYQDSYYGTTKYKAEQYVFFGQLIHTHQIAKSHKVLTGAAMRYTFYDDNTVATQSKDVLNTILPGIFIQDHFKINNKNALLAGLRYDYNSRHGSIFSPRLNYKWNSNNKNTIFRLGLGNGYRVANIFTEDHAALTGARDVEFKSNLKPETSYNVNFNLEQNIHSFKKALISIDFSAFYTYFTNRIIADYETNANKIIYDNLNGHAVSQGISSNIQLYFLNGVKLRLGANLQDISYVENSERKTQLLTEKFSSTWSFQVPISKLHLKIDYTGNLYSPMRLPLVSDLDSRAPYSSWWSLQNIKVEYTQFKRLSIYGGVKNLLNFTPPSNSIARSNDPFDKDVTFDANGNALATPNNPEALTFDPTYVYAPNQGIRFFIGFKFKLD